jgi:cyclase
MSAPHDHAHDRDDLPPPTVEEVADGVFAYVQLDGSWGLNNAGFLPGSEGVTVIDTCFTERRTRELVAAIGRTTDRPLRVLVNTHHHGDHTHGNWLLPGTTVIGHTLCRAEVLASGTIAESLFPGVEWGEISVRAPFVTFDDHLTIHVDDTRVELSFMGPAHTTNDISVFLPDSRTLFAGDLVFSGGTPFVVMGSVAGSLAALERLHALDATTIVPGHGPVRGPDVLDEQVAYLRFVQALAADAHPAGVAPLDAARDADLGMFAEWHDTERLVGNLHRAYAELDGGVPGAPIDVAAAIGDMITFNGGRPLRCLA